MPKKRKLPDFDPDDEPELDDDGLIEVIDPTEYVDDPSTTVFIDFSIVEADILDLCGAANARRGLALFLRSAVDKRGFDGRTIRAQVTDDSGVADAAYDFDALESQCSCPAVGRAGDRGCAHVAALQYAWMRQPQSFELANLGAALELHAQQPELFAGSGLDPEFLQSLAAMWESAPPELRHSIAQMSLHGTPEQAAQLEDELNAFAEQARDQEFTDLLGRLTLEQLRAIAKRRHWTLRATAKSKAVAELIDQLRASPLPDSFSPEEEQLVRIENTLWGLEGLPRHQNLLADWQAHAGGNLARLEHALEGLQNGGVLFPSTGEDMGLHYHWSPFIRADMLPLLQPNVALSPAKGAQAPGSGPHARTPTRSAERDTGVPASSDAGTLHGAGSPEPPAALPVPLPLLTLLDAVLIFAEREPLRLREPAVDPRLAENELVGTWPYLPEEAEGLTETRRARRQVPIALTVPFQPYFADETLDALGALAGGLREYGAWAAAMLVQAGVIQATPAGGTASPFGVGGEAAGLSPSGPKGIVSRTAVPPPEERRGGSTGGRGPAGETRVDPARVSAWHMLAPDQRFEPLWKLWCAGALTFGDFRVALQDTGFIVRRSPFDPRFTPQALAAEMGLARQFVARVFAMLSPQTWYDWPAFAACIKRLRCGFLYTFTGPENWWIEHAPSAKRYDVTIPQQWDAAWLPLLEAMLTGPLRWFGAIEFSGQVASSVHSDQGIGAGRRGAEAKGSSASGQVASSDYPKSFRITLLGAWLFTGGRQGRVPDFTAAVAAEGPLFEWLDETTFRGRATPDAMRALAPLRVYAEPSRALLTFRVSMPAIGRALAQGAAVASIVETFAAAGLPLAAAVQARIETLVAHTGRLNLYERVTVLELGDDIALRELLATTALRAHIVHEFSPRLVVVRDEAVEALVAELVKKGHTPLLT